MIISVYTLYFLVLVNMEPKWEYHSYYNKIDECIDVGKDLIAKEKKYMKMKIFECRAVVYKQKGKMDDS